MTGVPRARLVGRGVPPSRLVGRPPHDHPPGEGRSLLRPPTGTAATPGRVALPRDRMEILYLSYGFSYLLLLSLLGVLEARRLGEFL